MSGMFVRDLFAMDINAQWKLGVYDTDNGEMIGEFDPFEVEEHEEWMGNELNGYITIKHEGTVASGFDPYIYFEMNL